MRGSSSGSISESFTGFAPSVESRPFCLEADFVDIFSSTNVFHSPQAGQRPIHFGDSYPQELQKYTDLEVDFAMSYIVLLMNSDTDMAVAAATLSDSA